MIASETDVELSIRLFRGWRDFSRAPMRSFAWSYWSELVYHVLHHRRYSHFPSSGSAIGFARIAGVDQRGEVHHFPVVEDGLAETWLRLMGFGDDPRIKSLSECVDPETYLDCFDDAVSRAADGARRMGRKRVENSNSEESEGTFPQNPRAPRVAPFEDGIEGDSTIAKTIRNEGKSSIEKAREERRVESAILSADPIAREIIKWKSMGFNSAETAIEMRMTEDAVNKAISRAKRAKPHKHPPDAWTQSIDLELKATLDGEEALSAWETVIYSGPPIVDEDRGWTIHLASVDRPDAGKDRDRQADLAEEGIKSVEAVEDGEDLTVFEIEEEEKEDE
jgi:DNA-directed RNA polymerase specialized sigma24 family protein